MSLFDPEEGKARREAAIEQVSEAADEEWYDAAVDAVRECARTLPVFTTDQVHEQLVGVEVTTHELRAMGAVMRRAEAQGWVEPTDSYWPSARPQAHRNPKRVWRSLIMR